MADVFGDAAAETSKPVSESSKPVSESSKPVSEEFLLDWLRDLESSIAKRKDAARLSVSDETARDIVVIATAPSATTTSIPDVSDSPFMHVLLVENGGSVVPSGVSEFQGWKIEMYETSTAESVFEKNIMTLISLSLQISNIPIEAKYYAMGLSPDGAILARKVHEAMLSGPEPEKNDLSVHGNDVSKMLTWPECATRGARMPGEIGDIYTRAATILSKHPETAAFRCMPTFDSFSLIRGSNGNFQKLTDILSKSIAALSVPDAPLILAMVSILLKAEGVTPTAAAAPKPAAAAAVPAPAAAVAPKPDAGRGRRGGSRKRRG